MVCESGFPVLLVAGCSKGPVAGYWSGVSGYPVLLVAGCSKGPVAGYWSGVRVGTLCCWLQVVPKDFSRRLLEWCESGFPELKDRCGPGLDTATKAVLAHPQFSETPQQVKEIAKLGQKLYLVQNLSF